MSTSTDLLSRPAPLSASARAASWLRSRGGLLAVAALGAVALALALSTHAHHLSAVGDLLRGSLASLVLFLVCGDALRVALLDPERPAWAPLCTLALGAVASGLALTIFGFLHLPLTVSLWVTLVLGLLASGLVRRRRRVVVVPIARPAAAAWAACLFIVFCLALIPAFVNGGATIYGQNPDSHQVAGIAVLFQHVPPQGRDDALPVDTVPPAWRFRYPIFYPLAAASNLSHLDPIRAFPAMAGLLAVIAALGFALLASDCWGAPAAAAPAIAGVVGLSWVTLHLSWHPYWNQLWGFALMPYALLFGWRGVVLGQRRSALLCGLMVIALALAYPLAAPYPLVILAAVALSTGARPRRPQVRGRRGWAALIVALVIIAPALIGAGIKLGQGLSQVFSPGSALWSGDVIRLLPVGGFVGTGGGMLPAIAVVALAAAAVVALPRRQGLGLGFVLVLLLAADARFRLVSGGAYMDFKHLSYVGTLVLVLAAAGVARWVASGSRLAVATGALLALVWAGAAVRQDRNEAAMASEQVTPSLFDIRSWARQLPPGASVRVDIPASGEQLWAVYMLGNHPVDALQPVIGTTYAFARPGTRAQYSLAWRYFPNRDPRRLRAVPPVLYASDPPVAKNDRYVLRRILWPSRSRTPDRSSTALVEP